jgi:hypothetical protein
MFTFTGAQRVSMTASKTYLVGEPLFRVFVDGVPTKHVAVATNELQSYTLVDKVPNPDGMHTLTLWYLTDPMLLSPNTSVTKDFITIKGFYLDTGTFGPAPLARAKRLRIIGDSITAGNQVALGNGCAPDNAATYASKLCEHFRANCSTTSLTGKGIWRNCCDDDAPMTALYQRGIPGDPTSSSDPSFVPDGIIINLGTNDYFSSETYAGDPRVFSDHVMHAYADFIYKLTVGSGRPELPVFCAFGPVTGPGHWIKDAVDIASKHGAQSVHVLYFSTAQQDGCVLHPGMVGHQQMFEMAHPTVSKVLGWSSAGDEPYVKLDISPAQLWLAAPTSNSIESKDDRSPQNNQVHMVLAGGVMLFIVASFVAAKSRIFKSRSHRSALFTPVRAEDFDDSEEQPLSSPDWPTEDVDAAE